MEFNVGDKIRVVHDTKHHKFLIGSLGTIVKIISYSSYPFVVKFNKLNIDLDLLHASNVSTNTRRYDKDEIELDKSQVVLSIINDL